MSVNIDDFEEFLTDQFNEVRFANDLLRSTNNGVDSTTLDLETPVKKINYDLKEINSRVDTLINKNPTIMVNQIYKEKSIDDTIQSGLKSSLQYLDISYQRLQDDVLIPYTKAQKLQTILNKIHQTSNILRDSLIYIHLATRIQEIMDEEQKLSIERASQVTQLYSQLQLAIQQDVNLKSLQVIKTLEIQIGKDYRRRLLDYLVLTLTKECMNTFKIQNNKDTIKILAKNLFILSPPEFFNTINKIILSHVNINSQVLMKTINSAKTFPETFDEIVKKSHSIYALERILGDVHVKTNSNLLAEYSSQGKLQGMTVRDLFWSRIASNFKKEIDISFKRGGPVGKALQKNRKILIDSINKSMLKSSDRKDYQKHSDMMLRSISILSTEIRV
ncbi:similar to Saccharomyces cerevisiae YNL051W COG5 Component of the conserved oligomeric Golgi complex (Cog1p through Cog8p) [Maudiozyma saulgeensis]|uniref:Conserved oligomeric Golgi complex subunit 5 n=1 Tax=Maudiozyma saulgeensis TaxID=1789683 RepID=A0A1X7R9T8_9SACH|nr:similar to Saccharomyces cerevisiae YNL051W COG5 Component of the conserved oligomeric Golgi complex (Cog1p through Cog8p) [Kazachstania saulgeensis]